MKRIAMVAMMVACAVAVGGCRRGGKSEKTYDLKPDNLTVADLPASKTLVADFASTDNVSVNAYMVATEDATKALDSIKEGKSIGQVLKEVKVVAQLEGPSGRLTAPRKDDSTKWSIL